MAERLKPEFLLRALIHQQTSATVFLTSNVGLYPWLGASIPTSNVIQSSTADPLLAVVISKGKQPRYRLRR